MLPLKNFKTKFASLLTVIRSIMMVNTRLVKWMFRYVYLKTFLIQNYWGWSLELPTHPPIPPCLEFTHPPSHSAVPGAPHPPSHSAVSWVHPPTLPFRRAWSSPPTLPFRRAWSSPTHPPIPPCLEFPHPPSHSTMPGAHPPTLPFRRAWKNACNSLLVWVI